jgi:hypothetical protein
MFLGFDLIDLTDAAFADSAGDLIVADRHTDHEEILHVDCGAMQLGAVQKLALF